MSWLLRTIKRFNGIPESYSGEFGGEEWVYNKNSGWTWLMGIMITNLMNSMMITTIKTSYESPSGVDKGPRGN
ncbi:hypothetical protein BJX63DRAFT_403719 [Aspergillus granulosus]|uniref:Uncharacterized protein n=1 Tax=Aspergillus granulosus TaxID=176169 RepID=A0ABR4H3B9_9EURO